MIATIFTQKSVIFILCLLTIEEICREMCYVKGSNYYFMFGGKHAFLFLNCFLGHNTVIHIDMLFDVLRYRDYVLRYKLNH